MELIVIWLVLGPLVGYLIGRPKGREGYGLLLGLLLGFIGWIIVAVMDPISPYPEVRTQGPRRACPYCAEQIQPAAVVCRYCGAEVEPVVAELYRTVNSVPIGWPITSAEYQTLESRFPSVVEGLLEACAEVGYPLFVQDRLTSAVMDVDKGSLSPQQAVAKWGR